VLSGSAASCTISAKSEQKVDDAASKLEMRDASMCGAALEGAEESAETAMQRRRTAKARRALRAKVPQLDKANCKDEEDVCDSESFSCDVAEASVIKARCVKTGHHVMINNRACRVEKIGTAKVWKGPLTGCFKTHLVARCIFTGKKFEHLCLATEDVSIAAVQKLECTVVDIGDDGELSLLTPRFDMKTDVNLPTETDDDRKLAERIKANFYNDKTVVVLVLSCSAVEKVVEIIKHKCAD
jgi:translation elongation factor P/translation initiation factor 5A